MTRELLYLAEMPSVQGRDSQQRKVERSDAGGGRKSVFLVYNPQPIQETGLGLNDISRQEKKWTIY